MVKKLYRLLGPEGPYESTTPGLLGGHRKLKVYGRLDCTSAARHVARGTYQANRVFFANQSAAEASGFRPCARCMPAEYRGWKNGESWHKSEWWDHD